MSLSAPFPWFSLRRNAMGVCRADLESGRDVTQQYASRAQAPGLSYLVNGQSISAAPFRGDAPWVCAPVRVGVSDVLCPCHQFEIRGLIIPLIKVTMVDLLVGPVDGAVEVCPDHAMSAHAAQFAINPQHQPEVAVPARRFGPSREGRAASAVAVASVPPNTTSGVNTQRAVSDQIECSI